TASFYCGIAGFEIPMKAPDLTMRYGNTDKYREQVNRSLKSLIKAGWFLPLYSKQVEADARAVRVSGQAPLSEAHPH
ncbi:MAG TPA: alpha/beta hydrolase domain-containing protein, partial [Terriglobia bacterium]|nr:alpha/beta hydrolase domain-containing protein [Terriglobia bacterium]